MQNLQFYVKSTSRLKRNE